MHYAFYKESGEDWTFNEIKRIQTMFPAPDVNYKPTLKSSLNRKWVYWGDDNKSGYYMWHSQEKDDSFSALHQVSYESIINPKPTHIYKLKDFT